MKKTRILTVALVALSLVIAGGVVMAASMTPEMLAEKTAVLDQRVAEGVITEDVKAEILEAFANCDGNKTEIGKTYGISFGRQLRQGGQMRGLRNGK
ncbi:MAG: hypothetical protein R6W96_01845 [Clostridia bacterium]